MLIATFVLTAFTSAAVEAAPMVRCTQCTLSAQAEAAPPLPGEQPNVVQQAPAARTADDLQRRVDELNREIRAIDINPAPRYIIMGYAGYLLAPTALASGVGLEVLGIVAASGGLSGVSPLLLIGLGVGALAVGVVGIILIVHAFTEGSASVAGNRKRREELIDERIRLEDELRRIRRSPSAQVPVMITLATF